MRDRLSIFVYVFYAIMSLNLNATLNKRHKSMSGSKPNLKRDSDWSSCLWNSCVGNSSLIISQNERKLPGLILIQT